MKALEVMQRQVVTVTAEASIEDAVRLMDKPLLHLIKTRASQINGCACCLDMHTKNDRAGGETEQRLEIVDLTLATVAINAWNRLGVAFQAPVGSYQPQRE